MSDVIRAAAGCVLLVALALAPLNYGSTRLVPFELLIALCAIGAVAWGASRAMARTGSVPPRLAQLGVTLIAVSAVTWILALVVPALPDFTARHLARISARWPYSVVPREFGQLLWWSACAIGAWFALADLARQATWRWRIAAVMLVSGGAVALLGLLQNATRAKGIFWDDSIRLPGAFFGTFFHHTSAGAYLNSVWPLGFALALVNIRSQTESPRVRSFIYGSLVCSALILAAHSGHVSRLPQVIALVVLVGFTLWIGLWRAFGEIRGLRVVAGVVSALLLVAVLGFGATRLDEISARWGKLDFASMRGGHEMAVNPPVVEWPRLMRDDLFIPSSHAGYVLGDRGAAYATAWQAIKERPWFGWGPGGWIAASAATSTDPFIRTFYLMVQFTHNDFLQTWVEWGVIGAAGWTLLVPGAAAHAFLRLGRRPSQDFIGAAAAAALASVLIQSLIDFPLQIPAIQFNALALSALAWSAPGERLQRTSTPPFLHS